MAKKSLIEDLPESGETLDLSSQASELWSGITVNLAQITASTIGTSTAYNTVISASYETEAGDSQDLIVDLLNIPETAGSGNYRGRMFIYDKRKSDPNAGPVPTFLTATFEKASELITMYTREFGLNFTEEPTQFLDSNGMIDFSLVTEDNFEAPQNQAGGPQLDSSI